MVPRFRVANPVNSGRIEQALDDGVRRGVPRRTPRRGKLQPAFFGFCSSTSFHFSSKAQTSSKPTMRQKAGLT